MFFESSDVRFYLIANMRVCKNKNKCKSQRTEKSFTKDKNQSHNNEMIITTLDNND